MRPLLTLGTTVLSATLASAAVRPGAGTAAAQYRPVCRRRPALSHGRRLDRADHGGDRARGREPAQRPCAIPDLHHGERVRHGDRPYARRHRRLLQHHLCRLPGAGRRQYADAVFGKRRGARRRRRAFFRQLPRRGDDPQTRPRQGLQHRLDRQDRPGADLRSDGALRRANHPDRRRHRHAEGHPVVGRSHANGFKRRTCRSRRRRAAPTAPPAT